MYCLVPLICLHLDGYVVLNSSKGGVGFEPVWYLEECHPNMATYQTQAKGCQPVKEHRPHILIQPVLIFHSYLPACYDVQTKKPIVVHIWCTASTFLI